MALDKKVFQIRARTAIAYAVVMLTGLLWNEWSFFFLFSIEDQAVTPVLQWGSTYAMDNPNTHR